MKSNFVTNIQQLFKNIILNATGAERTLYEYIEDGDVLHALNLMTSNEADVDNAIKEYNPQKHDVMLRPNKRPKGKDPYITCKLPRCRQRYINEIELFFLLGNPIVWKKVSGDDKAFSLFTDYLRDTRFDSNMRKVKRIAGSETECAKLYRLYRDGEERKCDVVILARTLGYELRILKDQYGKLVAFAYGFKLRGSDGKMVQHWNFLTADMTYETVKDGVGWSVSKYPNPTGKINLVYFQQDKSWSGVEPRISREEELDSKIGDTNNYFADPIAKATADVIESIIDPDTPAKLLQLSGKDSNFEYINPPQSSELRKDEKQDLQESILFDTFTPDFSFEKLRGLGSVSGRAIKNAMALGYIKRANRMEDYSEFVDRERSVILSVLKFLNPDMASLLDELVITFEFAEPFDEDVQSTWDSLARLYEAGLVSMEEAVMQLGICDEPQTEIKRLKEVEKKRKEDEQHSQQIGFVQPKSSVENE